MSALTLYKNSVPKTSIEDIFDVFFDNIFWLDRGLRNEPASYEYDEENKQHVITVSAPGFKKEDIKLEVDGNGLTLKGEITDETMKNRLRRNAFSYSMKRNGIDPDSIDGSLENGILQVRFKTEKEKTTRVIEIK